MSDDVRVLERARASRRCSARSTIPPRGSTSAAARTTTSLDASAVAVVGARACSPYGAQVARRLGRELAAAGLVVVSGLARGIDGEAHRGALEAGGLTVAVLGCGIDRDYPAAHAELARRIRERGLVVSEYEPGVEPAPWRFPARNRIIAGLCAATVVVEARERSGALITADLALEEGRDVLAVPGEITVALSAGTNALLKLGATPCTSAQDVLELFGLDAARRTLRRRSASAAAAVLRRAARRAPTTLCARRGSTRRPSRSRSPSSSSPGSRPRATGSSGRRAEDRARQRHALEERLFLRRIGQRLGLVVDDLPCAGKEPGCIGRAGHREDARVRERKLTAPRVAVTYPPHSSSFATA